MIRKILIIYLSFHLVLAGMFVPGAAQAQEEKIYTIAILNMDAKGVSPVEAEVLSERLRSHISQALVSIEYTASEDLDQYQVVEQTQVERILEQFEIQNIGCVSDSCAIEFGKMLQVDRIVIGQIGLVGNTYLVSVRIIDVESGKSIANSSREHKGSIDDILGTVILDVGDELLFGKKKSRKKLYIYTGIVIAGVAAAAALSGGGGDGDGGVTTPLPEPPGRPSP